jgi:hypothetical protein
MSLFFWIVVAAAIGALGVGLFLMVRTRRQQLWEELTEQRPSNLGLTESARASDSAERHEINIDEFDDSELLQDGQMNTPNLSQSHRGTDLRRSSRVERPISLVVLGTNRRGEIFQERTSALSVNLHGCRYTSRHEYAPEGWVTLQVTGTDGANSRPVRARVRSVFTAQNSRELCQVGVELENPGNVWGITTPPEDWQRVLGDSYANSRNGSASTALADAGSTTLSAAERATAVTDRRAEVTVFPGATAVATEDSADKDNPPTKAERVVVTAEQLLQALQGKLQSAADRAVQASLSTQIDDAVKAALGKIEDGWKANVRQTEEFSAARMTETQALWEKELHAYRDRAEEVARRIEALTSLAQQALGDSQKFVERIASDTAPQLQARVAESLTRAYSDFETRATELSTRHLTQLNENVQRMVSAANSQLSDTVARAQAAVAEANTPAVPAVTAEQLQSELNLLRAEAIDRVERRMGELFAPVEQQVESTRNRANEIAQQLEGLALESRQGRAQHEQGLAEVRSLVSTHEPGIPQEQLNSVLNSSRQQIFNHVEWRIGEISAKYEEHLSQLQSRADALAREVEKVSNETRERLTETLTLAERNPRGLAPQDLATIEQAVGHAIREFENAAARVSDRQLIRMMEQKQVVTREASLELEARASEVRSLLQKGSNTTSEEFRRRIETQVDQLMAESSERFASSLASLDAESRAKVEERRRTLEADVARAAEQSTMEFRSGIKAFLYSCLVAAVSAVDQHAQTTLAGLSTDPANILQRALDAKTNVPVSAEVTSDCPLPPKAASNSQ